jgi:hypothetical protein
MDNSEIYDSIIGCVYLRQLANDSNPLPDKVLIVLESISKDLLDKIDVKDNHFKDTVSKEGFILTDNQLCICKVILDEFTNTPYISNIDMMFVSYANDIMMEHTKTIRDMKISKLDL